MTTIASGHGIATIAKGVTLDVWFPSPAMSKLSASVPAELSALVGKDDARGVSREVVSIEIDISKAPADAADAYLRLHLLSHRLVKPHGLALDGVFGISLLRSFLKISLLSVESLTITVNISVFAASIVSRVRYKCIIPPPANFS